MAGGTDLLAVGWSFTLPALAVCLLRIYVRLDHARQLALDDYFMAAAGVFSLFYTIMLTVDVSVGFGTHLDQARQSHSLRAIFLADIITWFVAFIYTIFLKLSITTFLLRLRPERYVRFILWFTISAVLISLVYVTVVQALRCQPMSRTWNKEQEGTCLSKPIILASNYMLTAVCAFSWFIYVTVPIALTWNLRMHPYTKRAIWGLIGLGVIPMICAPLKIPFSADLANPDLTWHETRFHIVLIIENNLGIIIASLPPIKPLLDRRWPRMFIRTYHSSFKQSNPTEKKSRSQSTYDEIQLVEKSGSHSGPRFGSISDDKAIAAVTVVSVTRDS